MCVCVSETEIETQTSIETQTETQTDMETDTNKDLEQLCLESTRLLFNV